jgi:hypothetical protein
MLTTTLAKEIRKPRICMQTARKFKKKAFHCGHYEAQDVLQEIDAVDLICLEPASGYEFKEQWLRRFLYRDISKKLIFANPGLQPVRLKREYDLFIATCQTHHDLLNINAIEGWKDHCKTSVLWIDEMWAALLPRYKYWLHALRQFDHIFVGAKGTVGLLSELINRPCHWLSGAADTLRFSPYPNPPARVVDVYSMGRRWEGIHQALLGAAKDREIFYVYDTFQGSLTDVYDHRQHRNYFANMAKRSHYFMVAPGKIDASDETRGQQEVGYRYYEGAAAGVVMIGQAPDCDAFSEMFPWQDAVIKIQPDGSDIMQVLRQIEPEQAAAIAQKNAVEALLRHDWVYRWKEIFRIAGVESSPEMEAREKQLKGLANLAVQQMENKVV